MEFADELGNVLVIDEQELLAVLYERCWRWTGENQGLSLWVRDSRSVVALHIVEGGIDQRGSL